MDRHIRILGWLYIAHGAIFLLVAGFIFVLLTGIGVITGIASGDFEAVAILPFVAFVVAMALTFISLPGLVCGAGLLRQRGWARILALVLAVLNIFNLPFGTALSVYTFWVLLNEDSSDYFRPDYSY